MDSVKRTPLAATHQRLGARMTPFGGYEMPLSYGGIIPEHLAVRRVAGIFDLSHMGEFWVEGPAALALLERVLTNSAARLVEGQAQYTLMCAADGGTIDDLIVYRAAPDRYLLCVNAANIGADWAWLSEQNRDGAAVLSDRSDATALVAVQGPQAVAILARCTGLPLASIRRFHFATGAVAGVDTLVARTGYTGEDGFELFCAAADCCRLFEALLAAGSAEGLLPCGLGARDTLRMEAGLPLYGHELDRGTSPLEANLNNFVKFGRDFIGAAALAARRDGGASRRLVGIRTDDGKSVARQGYRLHANGAEVGIVTSGTYAPSFERPLAMAYLGAGVKLGEGDRVEVAIRNRRVPATIVPLPFYRR